MNVVPGSAFFQTVQGSAASSGGGGAVPSVQASAPVSSATERQRPESRDIQVPQQLRSGPPGTNLDIIV